MYVFILDFNCGSVFWHKLPDSENNDSAEDYLTEVLNIDLSCCQWMITKTNKIEEI